MRILVTGSSGMLGSSLAVELSKRFDVYASGNSYIKLPVKYMEFNLLSDNYNSLISWSKPNLIIHCAALTNSNYCQNNPKIAFEVNGLSMNKLLLATNKNVKVIYVSTDAIFSSSVHKAKENDPKKPESVYGKSKELAEFFLEQSDRKYYIIRTTIVGLNIYSKKESFTEWILNSNKNKQEIKLFDDVIFNPISIWELIDEIVYLISREFDRKNILHISGNKVISKYDFGIALKEKFSLNNLKIIKSSILNYNQRANRSLDQTLDNSYYTKKYKRLLPNIDSTINLIHKMYSNEK